MIRSTLLLVLCLAAAACSTGPKPLAKPDGQVFRLNPERWDDAIVRVRP